MEAYGSRNEVFPSISGAILDSAVKTLKTHYRRRLGTTLHVPEVEYLDQLPSYEEFFNRFLVTNQLCVISEKATRQWNSRRDWVDQDGAPHFHFLRRAFGEAIVPVANCKNKEFSAHAKQDMTMSDFLSYWQGYRKKGHPSDQDSLYLKDWHFTRAFPEYKAYSVCSYFRSDWINEFWDVREDSDDDYRFVYMGPKGTWTPFHADVFRSFSWSANICGRKRWVFFPPGEEENLKDVHGNLVFDTSSEELNDPHKFPSARNVQHRIEIIQHPGETIFVPSGWHHQVENLEDTISINHNWLNGCNVHLCWMHLQSCLADIQQEIADCRDMEGWDQQCQVILKALTGLDHNEFFRFMESIARRRLQTVKTWHKIVFAKPSSLLDTVISTVVNDDVLAGKAEEKIEKKSKEEAAHEFQTCRQSVLLCSGKFTSTQDGQAQNPMNEQGVQGFRTEDKSSQKHANRVCSDESQERMHEVENAVLHDQLEDIVVDEISYGLQNIKLSQQQDKPIHTSASCLCTAKSNYGHSNNTQRRENSPDAAETSASWGHSLGNDCGISGVMLDLWPAAGKDPPHWSHCNLHHALFDLASIAMVLQEMHHVASACRRKGGDKAELVSHSCDRHEAESISQDKQECSHQDSDMQDLRGNKTTEHVAMLQADIVHMLENFDVKAVLAS